ncbi:MAG TPA: protein kinase, partial [Pirellulales bacterium]|nr:protein kinase [Pirellulales bacterium]
ARKCLSSMGSLESVRQQLLDLGDDQLREALGRISTGPGASSEASETRTINFGGGPASSIGDTACPSGPRFRIVRPHAKGGLGEVFVAVDGELNRHVALKHIQDRHADDAMVRNRFLLEAEITGGLEHPSIVPVYGLGIYPDGRPYYAMRFIRGDSLLQAIKRFHRESPRGANASTKMLELRKLLGRLISVCDAIEYAHSRGVLHRDLKPGNIMLGKYGETLVVDWGLAKPDSPHETANHHDEPRLTCTRTGSVTATQTGSAVGTPQYMSPEQAGGQFERLRPASDIYSLGATLYCLLTGQAPFRDKSVDDVLRKVRSGEFQRPRELNPQLPRGLEMICLKAMALEPANRYLSARALADDVEHWLADEPVSAFAEPWNVRLARWGRRHRTAMQVGVISLVVLACGALAGAALIDRARQETEVQRGMAEQNFRQARDGVDRYYTNVSENRLLQQPGMQGLRKDLLEDARAYYLAFVKERTGDRKLREELGAANFRVGKITGEIGSKDEAMTSLEEAARIQRELLKEQPGEPRFELALSNSWNEMGRLEIQSGRLPQAEERFEKARELRQHLVERVPDELDYQRKLANSLMNLGAVDGSRNQIPGALERMRKSIEIHQRLVAKDANNPLFRRDLAKAYYNLALLERRAGRPADALGSCRRATILYQQLYDEQPQVIEFQGLLTLAARVGDELSQESGHGADSLTAFEDARRLAAGLVERNPQVGSYRSDLAAISRQIGRRAADPEKALEAYRQAKDAWEQLARDNPANLGYQADLVRGWQEIGDFEQRRQHADEALAAFEQALAISQRLATQFPGTERQVELARAYANVALVERALPDRKDAARAKYDEVLRIYRDLVSKNVTDASLREGLATTYLSLGLIADSQKKPTEALEAYHQAVEEQRRAVELAPQAVDYRHRMLKMCGEVATLHRSFKRLGEALAVGIERRKFAAGNGPALIAAARSLALTAARAEEIDGPKSAEAEQAKAAAVAALKEADALQPLDLKRVEADPAFAVLKDRADFSRLKKK